VVYKINNFLNIFRKSQHWPPILHVEVSSAYTHIEYISYNYLIYITYIKIGFESVIKFNKIELYWNTSIVLLQSHCTQLDKKYRIVFLCVPWRKTGESISIHVSINLWNQAICELTENFRQFVKCLFQSVNLFFYACKTLKPGLFWYAVDTNLFRLESTNPITKFPDPGCSLMGGQSLHQKKN